MSQRFVIVGGDAAGMSAAMAIRRTLPKAVISVFEQGPVSSYGQCDLPYFIEGLIPSSQNLIVRPEEAFRNKYKIDTHRLQTVTHIDPGQQTITVVSNESKNVQTVPYDRLLIATGARPIFPSWPGKDFENGLG